MPKQIPLDGFTSVLFDLLAETFANVRCMYLDKGTSLFETLEQVSAEEASRRASERCASIAAHVKHASFYMRIVQNSMLKREVGKVDWKEIWRTTREVTPQEWEDLKRELRETHAGVLRTLKAFDAWDGEEDISGALSIVVHTAYHLGAIRQALCLTKESPRVHGAPRA